MGSEAERTKPEPRVTQSEGALSFTVRNGFEWGGFYVRPFKHAQHDTGGVEVVVNSSFGVFGYCWAHIGKGDWRAFLASLDMDYAMRKMCPRELYEKPLDQAGFVAKMREAITDWKEQAGEFFSKTDAQDERAMLDVLDNADATFENMPPEGYFHAFNEAAYGFPYTHELYDVRLWEVNPQVTGFWEKIWTPFGEKLAEELGDDDA